MSDFQLSRRSMLRMYASATAAGLLSSEVLFAATVNSAGPFVAPNDARLGALKDLNGYFPFKPSGSIDEWNTRKEFVTRQTKVACAFKRIVSICCRLTFGMNPLHWRKRSKP